MKMDIASRYSDLVGYEHRQRFGQFFTPLPVASFMSRWALGEDAEEVFDPAVGLGVFFRAARDIRPNVVLGGSEIDPVVLKHFRNSELPTHGSSVTNADYLSAWGQKHQAIVCNPPYMRFQNFINRSDVSAQFKSELDVRLSGYTNAASAFLLKSLAELDRQGRLAYIMPLEFLNAGYGTLVKTRLLEGGKLKALIRLEAEHEIFPDSITSIGIVLVANDEIKDRVHFYTVASVGELPGLLLSEPKASISISDLCASDKWLKYFESQPDFIDNKNLVSIREYGSFCRGIATGANEFFVLSPSRAMQLGIPRSALSRCIAKSNQVKQSVISDQDFVKLEEEDAAVFLFDVKGEPSASARNYIQQGESCGFQLRYLTKMRRPWYKVENRAPAPLLFGVFSREKFKVIRNHSSAVNLTCFHGFYPLIFGSPYIDKLFLYFQSDAARSILSMSMRRYGGGLDKFEPNDLNNALAPSFAWFDRMPDDLVRLAMAACKSGSPYPQALEDYFSQLLNEVAT